MQPAKTTVDGSNGIHLIVSSINKVINKVISVGICLPYVP